MAASAQQPRRNFLAEVSRKVKKRPTAALVYGVPGIGKTSFAAQIPGVVFMIDDKEDGINRLKESNILSEELPVLPECKSWGDALGILEQLRTETHDFKALAIDSLGGFERLCRRDFGGDWGKGGFTAYQQGYDVSLTDIRDLLSALDKLRDERGMSIMLLAHARVAPFKNPAGPDYDRYAVDVHHKTWNVISRWLDMTLFANYVVTVDTSNKTRVKGRGGNTRVFHTDYDAAFDAKNRHGLPSEIDMGDSASEAWQNVSTAIREGRQAGKDQA